MYTLQSVYAEHRFIYSHPWTRKDNNGNVLEQYPGWAIKFTSWGKFRDPARDEPVYGTPFRVDGLTAHWKAREGRALGKLELAEEADRMRLSGLFPDMTEEKLLDWFLEKYGSSKGVEWNVYDENGKLVPDEDLRSSPTERELAKANRGDLGNDREFVSKIPDTSPAKYRCLACDRTIPGTGISGHRRSKKHWANVEKMQAQEQQAVAV